MKASKLLKVLAAAALSAACVIGISGCVQGENAEEETQGLQVDTGLTGGVAATVNGVEIEEDQVTRYINNFRLSNNYETEEAWKEYLTTYSYTPEKIRDEVLDTLIDQQLVIQCADQLGATTSDEEIQSYVDKMRENYSSDEAWQTALEGAGFATEDDYREALNYSILNKKIEDTFAAQAEGDEAAQLEQAQSAAVSYSGAKKSSHILFNKEDKELAEEVLGKLKSGELDFAEAAGEYSQDTGSAQNGGDVGFDRLTTFVEEYQNALDTLEVDQISDLVESEYGYHIIKCTEIFNAPETLTSLDQIPTEILTQIQSTSNESASTELKDNWLTSMRESNDVVINPMPENVPYNVNMDDVESQDEQAATDEAADQELADDVANEELDIADAEAAAGTDGAADAAADSGVSDSGAANQG